MGGLTRMPQKTDNPLTYKREWRVQIRKSTSRLHLFLHDPSRLWHLLSISPEQRHGDIKKVSPNVWLQSFSVLINGYIRRGYVSKWGQWTSWAASYLASISCVSRDTRNNWASFEPDRNGPGDEEQDNRLVLVFNPPANGQWCLCRTYGTLAVL